MTYFADAHLLKNRLDWSEALATTGAKSDGPDGRKFLLMGSSVKSSFSSPEKDPK